MATKAGEAASWRRKGQVIEKAKLKTNRKRNDTRQNRNLFKITKLRHMLIKVEPLKARTSVPQCYWYQLYENNQDNCHRSPRRMKWGQQHISHFCKKPQYLARTCANCGGPHCANFAGCRVTPHAKLISQVSQISVSARSSSQTPSEINQPQTRMSELRSRYSRTFQNPSSIWDVLHQMTSIHSKLDSHSD